MTFSNIRHVFDHAGNHWLEAEHETQGLVRGHPVSYTGIAELGELRATTEYFGACEVYVKQPIAAEDFCCVTPYDENKPDDNWPALWSKEQEAALARVKVFQD